MRWEKNEVLLPQEEIASKIAELKGQGISPDKFALAYARVSTKHKEQEGSKENQVEDCKKYALKEGLSLLHVYECAESAKKMGERKVFNALIETALYYNIKNIILKDTSRLTRNLGDKERINQLVKKDKIQVHFYTKNEILNAESRLLISNIMSIIDADFSELLSEKMKWAAKIRKEKGTPYQLPAGLKFGKDGKGEPDTTKMEIDSKYEMIPREMFDLYLNKDKTLEEITKYFNSMGYRTRQNKIFYSSTIHRMLTNKAYTGKYFKDGKEWKPLQFPCPAYITEEQYEEIQRKIKLKSTGSKRRREKPYLLTGFVLCADCNSFASGNRSDKKTIFYTHKCKCPEKHPKPHWTQKRLFEAINYEVEKIFYDEKYTKMLKERLKKIVSSKSTIAQRSTKECNDRIVLLQNRHKNLLNRLLDGTVSKEDYKKVDEEIKSDLKNLEERRNGFSVDLSKHYQDAEKIIDAIRNFTMVYKDAFENEKMILLRQMAHWVHYDEKKVVIEWKKPFDILLSVEENVINHPSTIEDAGNNLLLLRVADGA